MRGLRKSGWNTLNTVCSIYINILDSLATQQVLQTIIRPFCSFLMLLPICLIIRRPINCLRLIASIWSHLVWQSGSILCSQTVFVCPSWTSPPTVSVPTPSHRFLQVLLVSMRSFVPFTSCLNIFPHFSFCCVAHISIDLMKFHLFNQQFARLCVMNQLLPRHFNLMSSTDLSNNSM